MMMLEEFNTKEEQKYFALLNLMESLFLVFGNEYESHIDKAWNHSFSDYANKH